MVDIIIESIKSILELIINYFSFQRVIFMYILKLIAFIINKEIMLQYKKLHINKYIKMNYSFCFFLFVTFEEIFCFYLSVILEIQCNINYYFFSYIISTNLYNSLITLILTHKLRVFWKI